MTRRFFGRLRSRTTVVVTLLSVAVLAPSGAWWHSGSRQAAARAEASLRDARFEAQRRVDDGALRLAGRLEGLRTSEDGRPFYHYQNLYHDPRGAAEGLSVIPSPLAGGLADPLVGTHFQIAADGRVTLPTVNDDFPELSSEDGFAAYCSFLADLEEAALLSGAVMLDGSGREGELLFEADGLRLPPQKDDTVVELAASQWEQIEEANAVYAQLAGRPTIEEPRLIRQGRESEERVEIRVGALQWTTLLVSRGPMLAALRQVTTPSGILVQGFSVDIETASAIAGTEALGRIVPGGQAEDGSFRAAVGETGWVLNYDAAPEMDAARNAAAEFTRDFSKTFALVFCAALFAAACAALLVAQTDSLARQRTRFAAAAAHELKTPLATLQLYSEMLAEDLGDANRRRSYARKLAAETGRLGRVVMNILDLSRLERGGLLVEVGPGNLNEVVEQCLEGLRPTLEESGLSVSWQGMHGSPQGIFDPDAVRQIVANLLDNAERYTRPTEDRAVALSIRSAGTWLVLEVADNGPGVAAGARHRLFRAFSRGAEKSGPAGLGLGLALARSLARAQGGDLVLVDDAERRGAVFELRVPIAKSAAL